MVKKLLKSKKKPILKKPVKRFSAVRKLKIHSKETLAHMHAHFAKEIFKKLSSSRAFAPILVVVCALIIGGVLLMQNLGSARADVAFFYPTSCLGGWNNANKAEGPPDVTDNDITKYNDENSATVSNTIAEIFCGAFKGEVPVDAVKKNIILKFSWTQKVFTDPIAPEQESQTQSVPESWDDEPDQVSTPVEESAEPVLEPEPTPEPESFDSAQNKPEPEPVSEITPEPTPELTPEPAPEITPEPTPEPAPEPVPAPEPAPAPEPEPEPEPTPSASLPAFFAMGKSVFNIILAVENEEQPSPEPTPVQEEPASEPAPEVAPEPEPVQEAPAPEPAPAPAPESAPESSPVEESSEAKPSVEPVIEPAPELSVPESSAEEDPLKEWSEQNTNPVPENFVPVTVQDAVAEILYTLNGTEWKKLGSISSATNEVSFQMPEEIFTTIQSLDNVQISVRTLPIFDAAPTLYLDSMWFEVEYEKTEATVNLEELEERLKNLPTIEIENNGIIQQSENRKDFQSQEDPSFQIDTDFSNPEPLSVPQEPSPAADEPATEPTEPAAEEPAETGYLRPFITLLKNIFKIPFALAQLGDEVYARVYDPAGNLTNIKPIIEDTNGKTSVRLPAKTREFKPGKYQLKIYIVRDGQVFVTTQDFTWGVLAINVDRSIYQPGDNTYIQMAVLDERGYSICKTNLELTITSPQGDVAHFTTEDGGIVMEEKCGPNNVIEVPDYSAHYDAPQIPGSYTMALTASTDNGIKTITDSFQVAAHTLFNVVRQGPTRINPRYSYPVTLRITPAKDWQGVINEKVPASFEITPPKNSLDYDNIITSEDGQEKIISWNVSLKKGEETVLGYYFDAPDISPEFYLMGPLSLKTLDSQALWQEARQWQIASDASISSNGTGGGNWSATGSWSGGAVPTNADTVTIVSGDTITLNGTFPATLGINGLTINNGGTLSGSSGTLNFDGTSGTMFAQNGTFTASTSTIVFNCNAALTLLSGTFTGSNAFYNFKLGGLATISTGRTWTAGVAFNVGNNFDFVQAGSGGTDAFRLDLSGHVTVTGTVTLNHGANASATLSSALSSWNLTTGKLVLSASGNTYNPLGATVTLTGTSGTLITNSSGTFTCGGGTGCLVNVTSASGPVTLLSSAQTLNALTIDASGVVVTAGAVITMDSTNTSTDKLYIKSGTLDDGGNTIVGSANGTMVMDSGAQLNIGSSGTASTFPTNYTNGIITLNSASTVLYQSGQNQTISAVPTYGNLTITPLANTPTMTVGSATSVAGNFTSNVPANLTNTGGITVTGSGTLTIYDNNDIVTGALTSTGGAILINADRDATSGGSVNIASAIASNGGAITIGGGSGTISAGSGFAVGTATQVTGVYVNNVAVNSAGGNIIVNGQGYATTTDNNIGVRVTGASGTITAGTSGSGTINVTGNGAGTTDSGSNYGLEVDAGGIITSFNGNLTVGNSTGGGAGAGATNYGVYVTGTNSTIKTTGSGNLSVTGTGGNASGSGASNYGVYSAIANGIQTTGTGNVTVVGVGGHTSGTGATNYGVLINVAAAITTAGSGGSVTITGTGGITSSGTNIGVLVTTPGSITACTNCNISVTGTGGNGAGSSNYGIQVTGASAAITATGTGTITLLGTGAGITDSGSDYGLVVDTGAIISSADGNLTVSNSTGGGAGSGTSNHGVYITGANSTIKTTGSGNVSVTGTGGNPSGSGASNYGIRANVAGAIQTTGTGNVTVVGVGGHTSGTGAQNFGVIVNAAAAITTAGSAGSVSVTGTGGVTSSGSNIGVVIGTPGTITACSNCNISVTGTGGAGAGNSNHGIQVTGASAAITATGTGTITLTGNGAGITNSASDVGVQIDAGAIVSSVTGNITVTGTGGGAGSGTANYGVYVTGASSTIKTTGTGANLSVTGVRGSGDTATNYGINIAVANGLQTTGTGTITVVTDTILMAEANDINSIGNLTIRPHTDSRTIGVGAGSGDLSLTDTLLGYVTWGTSSTLTIGGTAAGDIAINTISTILNKSVTFLTGGNISLASAALAHAGASAAVLTMQAYGNITTTSAITAATSALTVTLYSDYDAAGGGSISIGAGVSSNGGTITIQGGGGSINTTSTFDNLTINTSGNTITLSTALNISSGLTITAGTLDVTASGCTGSVSCAINIGGSWANSGVFTARTGTVTLNGSATQSMSGTMTSGSAFYNLIITNASGTDASDDELTSFVPGVDFDAAATATGDYIITTASVRVQYNSGSTYTFNNINWNGQASGTRIFFRNSAASGTWLLKVTGTQTAVSYINVSRSDASVAGGNTIVSSNSYDGQNNTNWTFGGASLTFSISDNTIGFGTLVSSVARYATGDTNGASSDSADTHTISVATSASGGYTVTINGATLTSGSDTVTAIGGTAAASSAGNEQFGLRLIVNSGTGTATSPYASANWALDTASFPDQVCSGAGDGVTTVYGVRYIGNISSATESGSYASTITYITTANF